MLEEFRIESALDDLLCWRQVVLCIIVNIHVLDVELPTHLKIVSNQDSLHYLLATPITT